MSLRYQLSKIAPDAYEFGKAGRDDYWKYIGPEVLYVDRGIAELERRLKWFEGVLFHYAEIDRGTHGVLLQLYDFAADDVDGLHPIPKPTPEDFK